MQPDLTLKTLPTLIPNKRAKALISQNRKKERLSTWIWYREFIEILRFPPNSDDP